MHSQILNDSKCNLCADTMLGTCEHFKEASKRDVFHLTSANNEMTTETASNITGTVTNQIGLREILVSNFDPKFATKIGIDFVPMQVMSTQDLRFIPFEKIDGSYPK
jgi:hypothetical protein